MAQDIITENRICRNCKKEYEARVYSFFGVRILVGQGYCKDCAKKMFEAEKAKEEAARQATIAAIRKQWRLSCGIPTRFMFEDFETFDHAQDDGAFRKAYRRCLDYANKFPLDQSYRKYPSLLLFSHHSNGVGKTHLACSIAHTILNRWNGEWVNWDDWCGEELFLSSPVKVISEYDIFEQIQASFNYSSEEQGHLPGENDIINSLVAPRLLVLDDVGKEKRRDSEFVQRTLFRIIDRRYKLMKPMVVTTNRSPERLEFYLSADDRRDKASWDRLWEMCNGKAAQMDGQSYRRLK